MKYDNELLVKPYSVLPPMFDPAKICIEQQLAWIRACTEATCLEELFDMAETFSGDVPKDEVIEVAIGDAILECYYDEDNKEYYPTEVWDNIPEGEVTVHDDHRFDELDD